MEKILLLNLIQIKQRLIDGYETLLKNYLNMPSIHVILAKQFKKNFIEKIRKHQLNIETMIMNDNYIITQFDIWVFGSGGNEPRTESTVWGKWWGYSAGDVAGYLPSIEGFLLLFLYSYFWLNIFTPTVRPLRIIFLGLCFLYVMAFSHVFIPEGWTHYS